MATRPNITIKRPAIPKTPHNVRLTPVWGNVALHHCQVCNQPLDPMGQEMIGGLVGEKEGCARCGRVYITELRL